MKEGFGMHFCPNCGRVITDSQAKYCSGCGMNLRYSVGSHNDKEIQRPTRRVVGRAGISGWQIIAAFLGLLLLPITIGLLVLLILLILGATFIMTLMASYGLHLASASEVIGIIGIGAIIDIILFLIAARLFGYAFKAKMTAEEFEK